jgi:hypothetical protein
MAVNLAISAARFFGKSRAVSLFAALVAVAGLVNELQRRRDEQAENEHSN